MFTEARFRAVYATALIVIDNQKVSAKYFQTCVQVWTYLMKALLLFNMEYPIFKWVETGALYRMVVVCIFNANTVSSS